MFAIRSSLKNTDRLLAAVPRQLWFFLAITGLGMAAYFILYVKIANMFGWSVIPFGLWLAITLFLLIFNRTQLLEKWRWLFAALTACSAISGMLGIFYAPLGSLNGESFNFGPRSQNNHTVIDLLNDLSKYWDLSHESYRILENVSFHEAGLLKLNCDKAIFHLDWRATMGYEDTTKFTSDWYNHYYSGTIDMVDFTLSQIIKYEKFSKQRGNKWSL